MKWIIIAVLAAIALYAIMVFNRLTRQRNMVREGWSGIDVVAAEADQAGEIAASARLAKRNVGEDFPRPLGPGSRCARPRHGDARS